MAVRPKASPSKPRNTRFVLRVQGDHAVEPGLDLALRVTFADDRPPIEIERATVQWVDGYDFGLDLVLVSPFAAKHMTDALSQQIRAPQSPT